VVDDETHDKIETTKTLGEILPSRISTTMEVGVSKICKLKSKFSANKTWRLVCLLFLSLTSFLHSFFRSSHGRFRVAGG
jgi:hypothetical protein